MYQSSTHTLNTRHNIHLYLPTEAHTHWTQYTPLRTYRSTHTLDTIHTYIYLRAYRSTHTHTGYNTHLYINTAPTHQALHTYKSTHTLDTIHSFTYLQMYTHQAQYISLHTYSTYAPGFTYIQKHPHTHWTQYTPLHTYKSTHTPDTTHSSMHIQGHKIVHMCKNIQGIHVCRTTHATPHKTNSQTTSTHEFRGVMLHIHVYSQAKWK